MIRTLIAVTIFVGLALLAGVESRPRGRPAMEPGAAAVDRNAGPDLIGKLPLRFEANRGQTDASVRFLCPAGGGRIFIQPDGAVMVGRGGAVAMRLLGADPAARVWGAEELPGRSNYLKGNDRSRWVTGVPAYRRVVSEGVYPGIDIGYRGAGRSLEYDFIVAPGADPHGIRLGFEDADGLKIDDEGNLVIQVAGETIVHRAPRVYQEVAGEQAEIAGRFVLRGGREVGFEVEDYDASCPLVVDPVIEFSTYLGGSGNDYVTGIALDDQGCVYVTGDTFSADFPTTLGAFDTTFDGPGYSDLFVTKLSADGSMLLYSTFIGGDTPVAGETVSEDNAHAIAVDGSGQAYVVGATRCADFPTSGLLPSLEPNPQGSIDAIVCILNDQGTDLVYSTYLGGSDFDLATDLALYQGDIFLTGGTYSPSLGTPGAFDITYHGGMDAFVAKLDPTGGNSGLIFFTYLGAAYEDLGRAIAIDDLGDAYVVGETNSRRKEPQFPTTSDAFLPEMRVTTLGGPSPFLSRISPDGTTLVYSTFFKNPDAIEYLCDVAVHGDAHDGVAFVTGYTLSTRWPTTAGAFSSVNTGHSDAVVTVIDTDVAGEAGLVYSTYIGGTEQDQGTEIALEGGFIYIAGNVTHDWPGNPDPVYFPTTPDAFATTPASFDAFLLKLDPAGLGAADLVFSTLIGGAEDDVPNGMVLGGSDDVYLAGGTSSTLFPVTSTAFDQTANGGGDGFVMRVTLGSPPTLPAAPTGLVATPVSSSAIALNWTDNSWNEDGFEIERSPDGLEPWTLLTTTGANATSYDDTVLQPQATWYYRVRAINAFGVSTYTNIASATTLPPAVGVNVDTITPSSMNAGTTIWVTITGSGFLTGATVSFENGQGPAPSASSVIVVSGTGITCTLSVGGGGPPGTRVWDLRVTNPDSSTGVLVDGFSVVK